MGNIGTSDALRIIVQYYGATGIGVKARVASVIYPITIKEDTIGVIHQAIFGTFVIAMNGNKAALFDRYKASPVAQ